MAHAKKTPILFFLPVNLQISKREPEPEEKKQNEKEKARVPSGPTSNSSSATQKFFGRNKKNSSLASYQSRALGAKKHTGSPRAKIPSIFYWYPGISKVG